MKNSEEGRPVVILGAGAAGLTAAWELARRGRPAVLLETQAITA